MKSLSIITVLLITLISCSNNNNNSKETSTEDVKLLERNMNMADTTFQMQEQPPPSPRQEEQIDGSAQKLNYDWDKKIVKTANLNAAVSDYKSFTKTIKDKVRKYGGYISSEQENSDDFQVQNSIVIKVPVQQFDNAVSDILNGATTINQKQISSEDVTTEYIDGKARLEAKKQVRLKYLELLQRAKNMAEIIEVQKEINAIQEEIELVNGRINYLSQTSAMSTIHFTYQQILQPQPTSDNYSFVTRLKDSFVIGWKWLGDILVQAILLWPFIIIGLVTFLIVRKRGFKWNKKAAL